MNTMPQKCSPLSYAHARRNRGFTLIELMIVVVIVGILASVAYPSYREHVAKTRRADAQAALMELAQFMERRYTTLGSYSPAGDCSDVVLPFLQTPRDGGSALYALGVVCTGTTFTLTASPAAGGPMAGDGCGNLGLTNTNLRTRSGTSVAEDQCWRR